MANPCDGKREIPDMSLWGKDVQRIGGRVLVPDGSPNRRPASSPDSAANPVRRNQRQLPATANRADSR